MNQSNSRILFSLAISQALNAACIPISFIVASLTIVELSGGNGRWAGVPSALTMLGGATSTFIAGRLLNKVGYRKILFAAGISGMIGSGLAGFCAVQKIFFPFLSAFLFMGMAIGMISLSRYAAAETSQAKERARAIGRVVIGSTVGAIVGPLLVTPSQMLGHQLGLNILAAPWLITFSCYLILFLVTFFLLRPEPKEFARQFIQLAKPTLPVETKTQNRAHVSMVEIEHSANAFNQLLNPKIFYPLGSMLAAQISMVMIMAITPLSMHAQNHSMNSISHVITAHFIGMFGLSILSGRLADWIGKMATVGLGGLTLALACMLAPFAYSEPILMVVLFLLGLGWSLCFIGGSSALAEAIDEKVKGKILGMTDAMISLGAGIASLSSGFLFTAFGFPKMAGIGLVIASLPCLFFMADKLFPANLNK